jgi:hypothetical protein
MAPGGRGTTGRKGRSMTTMEGWAVHLSAVADHTYVGNGNGPTTPSEYYACWGLNYTPGNVLICTGNGNTAVANCYRDPVLGYPDTAGIGIYGINGVCHQSANCFLYSANTLLTLAVRGYWLTVLAYGLYGTEYVLWVSNTYSWCTFWFGGAISKEAEEPMEPTVGDKVRSLFAESMTESQPPTPHQQIISQAAILAQHEVPGLDPASYQDLHAQYLNDKDAVVAKGSTGQPLAEELNNLSKQLQAALAQRLGASTYKKLTGYDAGETVDIIEHPEAVGLGSPPKPHSGPPPKSQPGTA